MHTFKIMKKITNYSMLHLEEIQKVSHLVTKYFNKT